MAELNPVIQKIIDRDAAARARRAAEAAAAPPPRTGIPGQGTWFGIPDYLRQIPDQAANLYQDLLRYAQTGEGSVFDKHQRDQAAAIEKQTK